MPTTAVDDLAPGAGWVARLARADGGGWTIEVVSGGAGVEAAAAGPLRVLFAGFLQNRSELARGDVAASVPELVAGGLQSEGERFLERLRGVFALLVTDARDESALCVRDQLGLHPLFWAPDGDAVLVSASPKALVEQPGVPGNVNIAAVVDHLRRRWPFREETYYEAVRRVPPGHVLRLTDAGPELARYWDPAPPGEPVEWLSESEAQAFGDVLEPAVRRALQSGPSGIFLSGGLDSVTVAAFASSVAAELDQPIPWALSLAFPRPDVNEEEIQRAVARDLGLPQVVLPWDDAVGPEGLIRAALELGSRGAAPLANFWSPAYDRLAEEGRAQGCRAILTGAGGDEWLGVSPYYAADLLRGGNFAGLYALYRAQQRSYQLSAMLFARNMLWRFGLRPLVAGTAKRVARRTAPRMELARRLRRAEKRTPEWLAPTSGLREQIVERERRAYADLVAAEEWLSGPLPRRYPRNYLLESRTALTHPLMAMEHEENFEQAHRLGLPVLQPFWDVDVVEFLYRIPPELLNRGGRAKSLVRETLARRFPRLGFERQRKVVAVDFTRSLFLTEGAAAWRALGGVPALAEAGLVDPDVTNRAVEGMLRGGRGGDVARLWDLLSSEAWFRAQR